MNYNEYREVINGEETYKGIAQRLKENKLVGIGWTDSECTHLDILFKLAIAAIVVPNLAAISLKVSPGCTSYLIFQFS